MASSTRSSEGRLAVGTPPALAGWLPAQRWFTAKSRRIAEAALVDEAGVPGANGRLALYRVAFTEGPAETYLLALPAGGEIADALDDPALVLALVELMRAGAALEGTRGRFRFTATP